VAETRFARNGDIHIAYQALGGGAIDLLIVDTWVHHVEAVWDFPDLARFLRRLSSFSRVIHFDRRGTGLSDPVPLDRLPDVDMQVRDAVAVLDAAGSREATVLGVNDGTLVAMLLAARQPERCRSLVLFAAAAKHQQAAGMPMEEIDAAIEMIVSSQVTGGSGVDILAPSRVGDDRFDRDLARFQRLSVRPGAIGHYFHQSMTADLTDELPAIDTPTLVLNRIGNRIVPPTLSKEVAALIPRARYVELPGADHLIFSQDVDELVDEIEEFVTGARTGADPDRALATVLFTDIVDSTNRAAALGDRGWRDVLDRHNVIVGAEVERFGGRQVATTGDGVFAAFDGPRNAVRCAMAATEAVTPLGIQIRAGVHAGEVEIRGDDLGGLAVHIGSRIAALAGPGEVLVSGTVRDLLAGSGIAFADRGEHALKGVPGTWRVFAPSA
jgi:class 3 adenylate cyclase